MIRGRSVAILVALAMAALCARSTNDDRARPEPPELAAVRDTVKLPELKSLTLQAVLALTDNGKPIFSDDASEAQLDLRVFVPEGGAFKPKNPFEIANPADYVVSQDFPHPSNHGVAPIELDLGTLIAAVVMHGRAFEDTSAITGRRSRALDPSMWGRWWTYVIVFLLGAVLYAGFCWRLRMRASG